MTKIVSSCQYVLLISNHIHSILQLMNYKFSDSYVNNLIETKCLNTAVMLIVLMLNQNKIPQIQYCDVPNTIQRHSILVDSNSKILSKLTRSLCRSSKHSYMYYIMLTDGNLHNHSTNSEIYFPGHVFIVEKTNNQYMIYQSYIGQYTLKSHMIKTKCNYLDKDVITTMCEYFQKFLSHSYVWNNDTITFWKNLTNVDSSKFVGYSTNNIYLCYRSFKTGNIGRNMLTFTTRSIKEIQTSIKMRDFNKYDNFHKTALSSIPKSIYELENDFMLLEKKLKKHYKK